MALKIISYENTSAVNGEPSARMVCHCLWDERISARNTLLGCVDANDDTLMGAQVTIRRLGGDKFCGYAELTCEFRSAIKVLWNATDAPFHVRFEASGEAVTVAGTFHWDDGTPLVNRNVLPTRQFALVKAVLFGARSAASWDISTIASYFAQASVNSDAVLGAATETLYAHSWSGTPRPDADGTLVYDVQVNLLWRPTGWNNFWREDTGTLDRLLQDGTDDPVYTPIALAGLLT